MSESSTRQFRLASDSVNAPQALAFKRNIAVVIGINAYTNGIPSLRTARPDAERLAAILAQEHEYDVRLLVDDVTKATLVTLLRDELPQIVGKDDRLLFYFAGHGIVLDSDDGPAGYLVPQDADAVDDGTFLPMIELHGWMEKLPCRHVLYLLDSCFAGAIRWNTTRSIATHPQQIYRERYQLFIRSAAWQAITSSAYDEKALDVLKTGDVIGQRVEGKDAQHSPFALALFDALYGAGDTYPPGVNGQPAGDGLLTATELFQYLYDNVALQAQAGANHRQTPGLWPLKKHHAGEYVFRVPGRELNLKPAPPLSTKNNPYRGLQSYDEKDAELFFGRTALIEQLAAFVEAQPVNEHLETQPEAEPFEANPLTVVLGASGTGKSSLVKAGLLPYLRTREQEIAGQGDKDRQTKWQILSPLRPSETPMVALAQAISELAEKGGLGVIIPSGTVTISGIQNAVDKWLSQHVGQMLLLVIDQFEELVTLCRNDAERMRFQTVLANLLDRHPDRVRIILTLRTDFEPQFADSPLAPRWQENRFIVPPLNQAELREIIEGPASVRVLFFDPLELVDELIDEVIQTPGALPLLSFTLEQLYLSYLQRQEVAQAVGDTIERSLTWADYTALGGVIGSLRTRADAEYKALPDDAHCETMRRVMLRMVAVEGGELARRRVPLAELIYPGAEENARVATVIERLVEARLLVMDSADADGDGVGDAHVEPAHDALVRAWNRLRQWQVTAEEELPLTLHRNLTQVAGDWEQADEKAKNGLLWNENPWLPQLTERILPEEGERIDALSYWLDPGLLFRILVQVTTKPTRFNQQETAFIQQSSRRRSFLWRRLVGVTLAVIVGLAGLAGLAELQRRAAVAESIRADDNAEEAQQNANQAEENAAIAQENEAVAIAAEATAIAERNEAQRQARISRAEELAVYAQSRRTAQRYADDVTLILAHDAVATTLQDDGYVTPNASTLIFDVLADRPRWQQSLPRQKHTATISEIAWSPDSKQLATADTEGLIKVWELATNEVRYTLVGHTTSISGMAWNADASQLVSAERSGVAIIWDMQHGQIKRRRVFDHASIATNAWSPDGRHVAIGNANQITIWDTQKDEIALKHTGHVDQIQTLAWSPQGTFLASGSADGVINIWYTSTMMLRAEHTVQQEPVVYLSWRENENQLAYAGTHSIGLWDGTRASDNQVLFDAGEDAIRHLFWHTQANGATALLATITTGAVKFWPPEYEPTSLDLGEGTESIEQSALSYDERILATTNDTMIALWDMEIGEQIAVLGGGHTDAITTADWHPEGDQVATASEDGSVIIWDTQSHQELQYLSVYTDTIYTLLWSPTGDRLVTTDSAENAKVWDAQSGQLLQTLAHNCRDIMDDPLNMLGITIALSGDCYLTAAAWSPGGNRLATAGSTRTVKIWNTLTGEELHSFAAHSGTIWGIAWSHNGQYLATASDDRTAKIWDADGGTEMLTLRGHEAGVWGVRWSPDDQQLATAGWDHTAKIWESHSGAERLSLTHNGPVWSADWHPSGERILTIGWDGRTRIWNANSGSLLESVQVEGDGASIVIQEPGSVMGLGRIWSARWSPDGSSFLTTSSRPQITLWDNEPAPVQSLLVDHGAPIFALQWSPDDRSLLTAGEDGTAKIWSTISGYQRFTLTGHENRIRDAAWNQYSDQIVTVSDDRTARIWDGQTGTQTQTLLFYPVNPFSPPEIPVNELTVDWHPTRNQIVIAAEWYAKIWDVSTRQATLELEHQDNEDDWYTRGEDEIFSAHFSPGGHLLLTAGGDNSAHVWTVASGQELLVLEGHSGDVDFAAWSHDGRRIATGSSDGMAKIWRSDSGDELLTLLGHRGAIIHLAWSHDDHRLATASSDGTIKIWDTRSGVELLSLIGHQGSVMQVAWSNDDTYVASAGQDGTARLWWSNGAQWLAQLDSRIQRNMTILAEDERWRYGY